MKKVAFHTIGCRLNQSETAVLADRLKTIGYERVEFGTPTDLLVLNTCSVTEGAEVDCRRAIRRTLRKSPQAFVAVTGCYAQTGLQALQTIPGVDLVLGNQFKMNLPDYVRPEVITEKFRSLAPGEFRKIFTSSFYCLGGYMMVHASRSRSRTR